MCPVSIESTLLLFLFIQNFLVTRKHPPAGFHGIFLQQKELPSILFITICKTPTTMDKLFEINSSFLVG